MKRILLIGGMALLCHFSSVAQNATPAMLSKASAPTKTTTAVVTPAVPTQTQAQKNEAAAAKTVQGQNNLRLGLPATATVAEYAAAKEKLYTENPAKYKEIYAPNHDSNKKSVGRTISRSDFNKMSAEQQAHITAHPERFKIID